MQPAPSKFVEKIVSLLIPAACREEVLGDLSEICTSSAQYIFEAARVVPMVIFSRIRRTADPSVLLMEATALYLVFVGAAWLQGKTDLFQDSGLLRLAIPPVWILSGLVLNEAYSKPGSTSFLRPIRGPLLGSAFAYLSQLVFSVGAPAIALPPKTMFYGTAIAMIFSIPLNSLFPPVADRPLGAAGPALWLKYLPEPLRIPPEITFIVKAFAFVGLLAFVGEQLGGGRLLSASLVVAVVFFLILRELKERR